jgi:hypothetical protein
MKTTYTEAELKKILKSIPDIVGWDFSYMRDSRQAVPWDYNTVIKAYLAKTDIALDIGTGDGKRFAELSDNIARGHGVDVDPEMIKVANTVSAPNMTFSCDDEHLETVEGSFTIITNRHAPYDLNAIEKKLESGGYFITQQVGEKNMDNVLSTIGVKDRKPVITKAMFEKSGLRLLAFLEYNVDYRVHDIESLLFWLNALDVLHAGFDSTIAAEDAKILNKVLANGVQNGKFVTNEHRYLVVAQKC